MSKHTYGIESQSNAELAEWIERHVRMDHLDEDDLKSLLALAFKRIGEIEEELRQVASRKFGPS